MNDYIIFGSDISAFTRKLEAAFECYAVDFEIKGKTADVKEVLEKRAGTHQIPVLRTPENWLLADTTPIMMLMDGRFPHRRLFPSGVNGVVVHILEELLDEWMARTMVHFRWHYDENTRFVITKLTGKSINIDTARQHELAQWGLRSCRATGTESVVQQAYAEKEYFGIIAALEEQLATTKYALGDRPTAVDAILMGTFRGHTNFDPIPDMASYQRVNAWNSRNHRELLSGSPINAYEQPSPFVEHLLSLAREQYAPFILANRQARLNGDKAFVVETYGEQVSYLARAYPERSRQLVVQRIHNELNAHERQQILAWLKQRGLYDCFAPPVSPKTLPSISLSPSRSSDSS